MRNFKFFVVSQGVVTGPFLANSFNAPEFIEKDPAAEFWVQGLDSWKPLSEFADFSARMEEKEVNPATAHWFIRVGERDSGPMNRWELESFLTRLPDLTDIQVRTEERKTWQSVYDFPHIIDHLGISRRKVPRASMIGHIAFKSGPESIITNARTISENGLGAFCGGQHLRIGHVYHLVIDAPHFDQPLNAQGEVLYRLANDEVGVLFHGINAEAKAKIISYVKRYSEVLRQKLATAA